MGTIELDQKNQNLDFESAPPPPVQGKLTKTLAVAAFAIVIGCSFQFGYHTGCINSSKPLVEKFMRGECNFTGDLTWIWAAIVALFPFGAIFGSMIGGPLADKLGRRMAMLINLIPALVAALLFLFTYLFKVWPLLFPGRFFIGINAGITSSAAVTYLTELAPINLRGMLGSCHQLVVTVGILLANVVSFDFIFGTENLWFLIYVVTFLPIIIQLLLMKFIPESPPYTLLFKKDEVKATDDLKYLRGTSDVKREMDSLKKQDVGDQSNNVSVGALWKYQYRWAAFIACFLMVMQQLSGINAAMYYSSVIFEKAGLYGSTNTLASCGLMLANVLMTIVSTYLVDHPRFGRRALLLAGIVGMFFCTIVAVVALSLIKGEIAVSTFQIIAVIFMILFVVSFATGPGSIPWFYVMELFAPDARASASAIACATNWLTNVAVGLLFPIVQEHLDSYTFLIFTVCLFVSGIFAYIYVPETKGRSVEEAQATLESNRPRWI